MEKEYVIGTRGSLLALTQCLQIKAEMERKGLGKFKLKIISTQGDENTTAPLWQLEGKDFFTKELDAALLQGEVDLVVHSYKDLGSERPEGITLAAITERRYANDILFIKNETIEKLQKKEMTKFVVGTSSPRRITNITKYLADYLPYGNEVEREVECIPLRGNVNTRLEKLVRGDFDAIVLALPGIERLAQGLPDQNNEAFEKHGDPTAILEGLLKDLNFMVLPLTQFPAAASQGALGIECLENREDDLLEKLGTLTCARTKKEVGLEREVFQSFGGGCHLAVGISARDHAPSGLLRLNVRGEADEKEVEKHAFQNRELPDSKGKNVFIGIDKTPSWASVVVDQLTEKKALQNTVESDKHILITSGSALEYALQTEGNKEKLNADSLWASGTRTMKKLAAQGLWSQGCADAFGEDELKNLTASHLVELKLGRRSWQVLTNDHSKSSLGETTPVYTKEMNEADDTYKSAVESCDIFYWTSYPQYEYFSENFTLKEDALHACGAGKTYDKFKEHKKDVLLFSGMRELKDWIL